MQKRIFISMSQPCSETTLSKWCCAGTERKRNGRWCANSGAPPPTSPTRCGWWGSRRLRGAGGPPCLRRGWASASSASSHHHLQGASSASSHYYQQGSSSASSSSSASLSTAVIILPERMNLNNSFDPLLTPGGCDEKLDQQKTVDDRPRWKGKMGF